MVLVGSSSEGSDDAASGRCLQLVARLCTSRVVTTAEAVMVLGDGFLL